MVVYKLFAGDELPPPEKKVKTEASDDELSMYTPHAHLYYTILAYNM